MFIKKCKIEYRSYFTFTRHIKGGIIVDSNDRKKVFVFQGNEYTSYYQLEKVMGIARRTIQYRHEVKGIPIDEVPNFVPSPPEARFGKKVYFPNKLENNKHIEDELKKIVEYPKEPILYIGEDREREKESKKKYISWLKEAPKTLIKRELRISEEELRHLIDREKGKYFYATTLHENEKSLIEQRIAIIKQVSETSN
ncbi:TPA: hypothetical protein OT928_002347 [Enterococcus faecalis]|nr:hypothetical protein [Enterococcus faecalis]HCT8112701.1 hypothetical protein [Enterococcus faecalis]